jgi:hypothetical protein
MSMTARAGRGGFVALSVIGVSLAAHLIAGGFTDFWSPLLLIEFAAIAVASVWLSGRHWTMPRFVVLLVASQIVLHFSMQWSHMSGMSASDSGAAAMTPVAPTPNSSWAMYVAHAGAVVVIVLLIRQSESRVVALIAILAAVVHPIMMNSVVFPPLSWFANPIFSRSLEFDDLWCVSSLKRRGPPPSPVYSRPPTVGVVLALA